MSVFTHSGFLFCLKILNDFLLLVPRMSFLAFFSWAQNIKRLSLVRWTRARLLQLATPMKPLFTGRHLFLCWNCFCCCVELFWNCRILIWNRNFFFTGRGWSPSRKTPTIKQGFRYQSWTNCCLSLIVTIFDQVDCGPRLCWLWRCGGEEHRRGVDFKSIHLAACSHLLPHFVLPSVV